MHTARSARRLRTVVVLVCFAIVGVSRSSDVTAADSLAKLDPLLQPRISLLGESPIVVRAVDADAVAPLVTLVQSLGGQVVRGLPIVDGLAAHLPNSSLSLLAGSDLVQHVSLDRLISGALERTGPTIGATAVRQALGYDGTGVGVAVVDSGVTAWHDDLTAAGIGQRVDRFVDFVGGRDDPYDDFGHGTHVAGIIAGNGFDSSGARSGIAPGAHLIVLKVLDGSGNGRISDVIAALDFVVSNRDALNIRIANLSIATGVYESYNDDPLTLAARRAVEAGIVVVAAAGNNGRSPQGVTQYAGITAPGNAPWVLTVGASSHMGTPDRADDTIAAFSSRGPGAIDYDAKPDLVAPGVGIESLADPGSSLYEAYPQVLLGGTVQTADFPYMSLSGTSMATPVVSGTVALMLQADPALTPNLVKAILQYTSQRYDGYDALTEGAGFLNAEGAVDLAAAFAMPDAPYPSTSTWSASLIWGNHLARGGRLTPDANAWDPAVTWGAAATPAGARIAWGVLCTSADCSDVAPDGSPWQTSCLDATCQTLDDASAVFPNLVWGSLCNGADCDVPWTVQGVGGATTSDGDTVVWGTGDGDTVVWGTSDGDTVVWGTTCSSPDCAPFVW